MITNIGDPDVHRIGSALLANIEQLSYIEMDLLFGKNKLRHLKQRTILVFTSKLTHK